MTLLDFLPPWNAALNALSTLLLTIGWTAIRTGRRNLHARCMVSAFAVSSLFLLSYLAHKALRAAAGAGLHTTFAGEGFWRTLYYLLLASHVLLAIAIVPLNFRTLFLARAGRFDLHRKWARLTFPLWYYVSITGVLVYFFLYHWFPSA